MFRVNWSQRMISASAPSGESVQAVSLPATARSIRPPKRSRISASKAGVLFHQISRGFPCSAWSSGKYQKSRMSRMGSVMRRTVKVPGTGVGRCLFGRKQLVLLQEFDHVLIEEPRLLELAGVSGPVQGLHLAAGDELLELEGAWMGAVFAA